MGQNVFDPYYKWLGIRPENQPPDHYRLLGLERFEADPDVIRAAGERQMAHVQSYKLGHMADLSQRILNEIARAKVCLLNPSAKSEYDRQLRTAARPLAAMPPSHGAPRSPELIPAPPKPEPFDANAPFVETRRRAMRRRNRTGMVVTLGATGALLAIMLGAIVVKKWEDGSPSKSPVANSIPKKDLRVPRHVPATPPKAVPRPAQPSVKPLTTPAPPQKRRGKQAIPPDTEQARVKEEIKKRGYLSPAQLLHTGDEAADPAARYVYRQLAIDLGIELAVEDGRMWSWVAPAAAGELVKEFHMPADFREGVDRRIETAMARAPTPTPEAPRSEAPTRKSSPDGGDARTIVKIDAPLLDLSKSQYLIPINKPLIGVDPKNLKIEAIQLGAGRVAQRFPADGIAKHGKPVRLVIRDALPKAGVELSLHGVEKLYVRVKPIVEDFDNKLYPWSYERMKKLEGVLMRTMKDTEDATAGLKVQIPIMRGNLDALKKVQRNAYNQADLALQQGQAEAAVAAAENRLQQLERQQPLLRTQVQGFEELFKLSDTVHRNARIEFRVFHDATGADVTLAEAN